jgi:serine/threonine protein kinase
VQAPENWARIKRIVGEALELERTRRQDFVLQECAGDEGLRVEVQSLIEAYHESDALSGDLSFGPLLEAFDSLKVIGAYHLVKKLGQGGMGQVWLAEQKSPVRRHVAIKLLNPGSYSPASMQRFESERQSLAMMSILRSQKSLTPVPLPTAALIL